MAEPSFFQTISNGAKSISSGFNTLMNGISPTTTNNMLQDALSTLRQFDVGRTAYFMVNIPKTTFKNNSMWDKSFPGGMELGISGEMETVSYFCHGAELPGESTATVTQKIYGVTEKFSVMTGYNDITLSFYTLGSAKEEIRLKFLDWLAYITGRHEIISSRVPMETTYNVKYKNEYVRDIKITHYSITGDPLTEVTLYDAFPISINQVPLNWAAQNEVMSLNVTFAYTEYSYNFLNVNGTGNYSRGPLGELIGTGIKAAAAINTISGAFKSGNPIAATSTLPNLGLSNFKVSSGLIR
jgi:hypothetical protein